MSTDRKVKQRSSEAFFQRRPVFRLEEFAHHLGSSQQKALDRLKYHLKRSSLITLERGLYALVPPGVPPARFQPDRYLVAAAARPDSIFSHHSALELLGAAHSDWNVCTVFTGRRRRQLSLGNVDIRFLAHPTVLVRKRLEHLGTRQVERLGFLLEVTGPERTLVDGFRQPRLVGGLSELVESAAGFGVLDLELLKRVLAAFGQKSLWAALGWFLEKHRETFFVPKEFLSFLEKRRPRVPQYLPRRKRSGVLVARWNLVLPHDVAQEGEPDEPE